MVLGRARTSYMIGLSSHGTIKWVPSEYTYRYPEQVASADTEHSSCRDGHCYVSKIVPGTSKGGGGAQLRRVL